MTPRAQERTSLAELDAMMRQCPGHEVETVADVLAQLLRRPAWQARAECRSAGVAVFFLERGQSPAPAKALCARCPVTAECEAQALDDGAADGIWAGTPARKLQSTHRQRKDP